MSAASAPKVKLVITEEGEEPREVELAVHVGADGKRFIDVSGLNKQCGMFTIDPGFVSTASCRSAISLIDGKAGRLLYRGYRVEELAEHSSFREVTFLLIHGHLPSPEEMSRFEHNMTNHSLVHEKLRSFYEGFTSTAHPMSIMCGVMGALSSFYHDSFDISDRHRREQAAYRIVAKMPTIAAMAYKYSVGQPFVYPRNELSYAHNFLRMMFAVPSEEYVPHPVVVRALDVIMILHADHGQNASTSTARIAGSSQANPFACIAAAIASLWGPAHGGANEAVLKMLRTMRDTPGGIDAYIARAKDRSDPTRVMGVGHRVYATIDPRAVVMKKLCAQVLAAVGKSDDDLLRIAGEVEKKISTDEYFVSRGLYPNVDFYSGIVFRAIGIPESMFTVMFAMGRSIGWVANWLEMTSDPAGTRIARPRQLYDGEIERPYTTMEDRGGDPASASIMRKLSLI